MQTSAISIRNLSKKYDEKIAVDQLNLEIEKGVVFGFLGPNGAGKSTTLRMILSLIKPTSGEIKLFGKSLNDHRKQVLSRVGSIIEKPDFYLNLSAWDNLNIQAKMFGVNPSKKEYFETFELVGLHGREKDKVKTFSHGMKQRLGLAQALIHNPELIILDEPTTGLDPLGIIELRELILRLKNEFQKTVVLSSHILSEIELIADEMTIINGGKAVVQGKVSELLSNEDLITIIEPTDKEQLLSILSESQWNATIHQINETTVEFKLAKNQIPEMLKFLSARDLYPYGVNYKRTLEDYFLKLTNH